MVNGGKDLYLPAILFLRRDVVSCTKNQTSLFGTTHVWWWSASASAQAQSTTFLYLDFRHRHLYDDEKHGADATDRCEGGPIAVRYQAMGRDDATPSCFRPRTPRHRSRRPPPSVIVLDDAVIFVVVVVVVGTHHRSSRCSPVVRRDGASSSSIPPSMTL